MQGPVRAVACVGVRRPARWPPVPGLLRKATVTVLRAARSVELAGAASSQVTGWSGTAPPAITPRPTGAPDLWAALSIVAK